jgi:hypothetical protein
VLDLTALWAGFHKSVDNFVDSGSSTSRSALKNQGLGEYSAKKRFNTKPSKSTTYERYPFCSNPTPFSPPAPGFLCISGRLADILQQDALGIAPNDG